MLGRRRNLSRQLFASLMILSLLLYLFVFSSAGKYKSHMRNGHSYYRSGQYAEAAIEYGGMIEANPGNGTGYFLRGMAYYGARRWEKAKQDYIGALRHRLSDTQIAEAHYNLALCYMQLRSNKEAIQEFTAAINYRANNRDAYVDRADSRRIMGDFKGCIDDITRAEQLGRNTAGELFIRGLAYNATGQFALAERDMQTHLKSHPNDLNAMRVVGWSQYEQGRLQDALKTGIKCAKLGDKIPADHFNLGLYDAVNGMRIEALTEYKAATAMAQPADKTAALEDISKAMSRYPRAKETLLSAQSMLNAHPD